MSCAYRCDLCVYIQRGASIYLVAAVAEPNLRIHPQFHNVKGSTCVAVLLVSFSRMETVPMKQQVMPLHVSSPVPAGSNELESDRTERR